jgi:hypothetical protein
MTKIAVYWDLQRVLAEPGLAPETGFPAGSATA